MMSEAYPKIETLFDREPKTFKVIEDKIRLPEFLLPKIWRITEKIDGTNVRICYNKQQMEIYGRTENAQMPTFLYNYLQQTFTLEKFQQAFPDIKEDMKVILYSEGYGPKIQKGGGNYRKDVSCRLFDVKVDRWWLEPENIENVAKKMCVETVPTIGDMTIEEAVAYVKSCPQSKVAMYEYEGPVLTSGKYVSMEGIVARTVPLLLRRNGERLMWKLKYNDFKP